jgi:hypothetical protein
VRPIGGHNMTTELAMIGTALSTVTAVLLVALGVVWARNYRKFRSRMLLGLLGFSGVLILENLLAVYLFLTGMSLLYTSDQFAGQIVLGMRVLELLAVALLTSATVR